MGSSSLTAFQYCLNYTQLKERMTLIYELGWRGKETVVTRCKVIQKPVGI
jgi:hypothetical protein